MARKLSVFNVVVFVLVLVVALPGSRGTASASISASVEQTRYFSETGHTVSGKFLEYWNAQGGLAVFGYPLTDAQAEVDPETGQTFLTQWFERNRFELHPENAGTPYEVLLGLLGKQVTALRRSTGEAPFQPTSDRHEAGGLYFAPTGHNLSPLFRAYWQNRGGLGLYGYPISEAFSEVNADTSQTYTVQYFERARFEYHPEFKGSPYEVLLGRLGQQLYGGGESHTYYINNQPAAHCSNSGPGTSQQAPWCDFIPANAHGPFHPGDQILLARGAAWKQQLNLSGSGSAAKWIRLGAYGDGPRPIISRNDGVDERGIKVINPDYWQIENLEISHSGTGLLVFYETPGHSGLKISNLYVHHNFGVHQGADQSGNENLLSRQERIWNSAGIVITGQLPNSYREGESLVRDVQVDHIEGTHNFVSLSFDFLGHDQYALAPGGQDYHGLAQDVVVNHLYLHDDDNPMPSNGGCDEGLRLFAMQHAVVMNSILDHEAGCHSNTGTAGVILGRLKDVNFVNSIIKNIPDTGSIDQEGFDYEYFNDNVRILNNLVRNTAGSGIAFLQFRAAPDHLTNAEAAGNVFIANQSAFNIYNNQPQPVSGRLRDNLTTNSLIYREQIGTYTGFSRSNDRQIGSSAAIYHSAEQFNFGPTSNADSQWFYQYYPNNAATSYQNLSYYNSTLQVWQASPDAATAWVGQFEQAGNSAGWTVRGWRAEQSGSLVLRGRLLNLAAPAGQPPQARITLNGQPIWSSNGQPFDQYTGLEYALDNIQVTKGDLLRFETSGVGLVSWVPVVAYLGS